MKRLLLSLILAIAARADGLRYWQIYTDQATGLSLAAMPFDTSAWAAINPDVPALRGLTIAVHVTPDTSNFVVRVDYTDEKGRPQQVFSVARLYGLQDWAGCNIVVPPERVTDIHVVGFQATTPEAAAAIDQSTNP